MGRRPCCPKEGLNRGAWTPTEDRILIAYIKAHGEGKWGNLPKRAGLKRCGKSCRLRWVNYLSPDIKRGNISEDEEELIIRLHRLLGNRWSLIAGRLPGRTDNEIKNYWNSTLKKKTKVQPSSAKSRGDAQSKFTPGKPPIQLSTTAAPNEVIRTKATKCSKLIVKALRVPSEPPIKNSTATGPSSDVQPHQSCFNIRLPESESAKILGYCIPQETNDQKPNFSTFDLREFESSNPAANWDPGCLDSYSIFQDHPFHVEDPKFEGDSNDRIDDNTSLDLETLRLLLESEDWPGHV